MLFSVSLVGFRCVCIIHVPFCGDGAGTTHIPIYSHLPIRSLAQFPPICGQIIFVFNKTYVVDVP